jgi:integrase/recombinase XerD
MKTKRRARSFPHSLDEVIQDTVGLWRKHHLGYDQTKYVMERVRRRLMLAPWAECGSSVLCRNLGLR